MNFFKRYKEYVQDNPNNYWFKRKLYGWGWIPAHWKGWLTIFFYITFICTLILIREESVPGDPNSGSNFLVFGLPIIISTILLVVITYKKGEKLKWQWGFPKNKDK